MDSEGNLLRNFTKHHRLEVCASVIVVLGVDIETISFVWIDCLFKNVEEDSVRISLALQTRDKV